MMTKREIGAEILEGIREIQAHHRGETALRVRELSSPSSPLEIRTGLGLSQQGFASLMGVSVRTIQEWEQGRREPTGPAKALLRIAEQYPQAFFGVE